MSFNIPDNYIANLDTRMNIYRKISNITENLELIKIVNDLKDRYGTLPESFNNLFEIIEIKILSKKNSIKKIDDCNDGYVLEFKDDEINYIDKLIELAKLHPKKIKLLPKSKMMYVTIAKQKIEKIAELKKFLKILLSLKMKDKNSDKLLKFNKFSFLPILDGLDTFLNLSIITYLSIFFLQNLDNRISILIMTFAVLLSFFSRNNILCLLEKFFLKTNYDKINLYFIFSIIYFIPIIIIQELNLFSLFIFVLCRFFIGNLFYIAKKDYLLSDSFKKENYFFLKYLIIFISGMLIGTLVYIFFNDIFSNSQMNSWGWKCSYIFLFIITLILGFFIKYNVAFVNFDRYKELKLNSSVNRNLSFNFKNICSIIPFYIFLIFSCENWLPKICKS